MGQHKSVIRLKVCNSVVKLPLMSRNIIFMRYEGGFFVNLFAIIRIIRMNNQRLSAHKLVSTCFLDNTSLSLYKFNIKFLKNSVNMRI